MCHSIMVKNSIYSDWVKSEAEEGRKRRILVPIILDGSAPPLGFRYIHAADLSRWDGNDEDENYRDLLLAVSAFVPHTDISVAEKDPPLISELTTIDILPTQGMPEPSEPLE